VALVGALAIALVALAGTASMAHASPGAAVHSVAAGVFIPHHTTPWERVRSGLGIGVLIGISWLLSSNRRRVDWRLVAWGVGLQLVFALLVLNPLAGQLVFSAVDRGIKRLLSFAETGADFVFQSVHPHHVEHLPSDGSTAGRFITETFVGRMSPAAQTFATWVLPSIVFFSALMAVLYHLGIMQWVVRGMAKAMVKTMRTSGSETLASAANVFLGQTEAPLLVRPFIAKMTQSELMAVMVGGFANVAGGVLAMYVGVLRQIPGIAGHLMVSSILSAPASLLVAKVMLPETERSETAGDLRVPVERPDANVIEALSRGASEGASLAISVAAMLIAFVAFVAMFNFLLGLVGLRLEQLLGWAFAPLAYALGIPWGDSLVVGRLLGDKLVLTELIAYLHLGEVMQSGRPVLTERGAVIASYALCGFANFASIGVQIGGIGQMAPSRRGDVARLGVKAMFGGALATLLTATVAGIVL
jgi:CNT family concentrative nucleoside transporter